tara:strand:- start:320 stop:595 length:276 start_codon:yes stop_codon:yes gene_type:complete
MADAGQIAKNIFKGIYVVIIAFFESITISFYKNIKKRWSGPSNEFKEVKVPKDFKNDWQEEKIDSEGYKEMPQKPDSGNDIGGGFANMMNF